MPPDSRTWWRVYQAFFIVFSSICCFLVALIGAPGGEFIRFRPESDKVTSRCPLESDQKAANA